MFHALVAHYAQYGWFLALWSAPLAVLAIAVGLSKPASANGASYRATRDVATTWTPPTVTALVALAVFFAAYAYALVAHEDLTGFDYAQLTATRFVGMEIWPDNGRFFPLAFQEYNLLTLIGKTAWIYYAFPVIELAMVVALIFRLLDETPVWLRCVAIASLIVLPSVQVSFFGLMYPERDVLFWLAAWLVCVRSFSRTKSRSAWCAALVVTQFVLYYKETAFTIVGGFAGARLALGVWTDREALRRGELARIVARHSLDVAMLALCGVFLAIYATAIAPHVTASYVNARASGASMEALISYVRSDPALDAMVVVFAIRLATLARSRRAPDPLWEPVAIGAIAYAVAFVKLGIVREYYLAPSDFLAVLYLARVGYDALRAQTRVTIAGAFVVIAALFQRNLRDEAYTVLVRKQFVAGDVRLASFLIDYAGANHAAELPLFFPQAGGFQLMELSSFLQYKGLRAAGTTSAAVGRAGFVVKTSHRYPDARCHPSQELRCEYAAAPRSGDLVVLLPGHTVAPAELEALRANARELLHFRPPLAGLERALSAFVSAERLAELAPDVYVFEVGAPTS